MSQRLEAIVLTLELLFSLTCLGVMPLVAPLTVYIVNGGVLQ
jgi:hypothetical protein